MCISCAYLRGYPPTVKYRVWIFFARLFTLGAIAMLLSGCAIPVALFYDEPLPKDRLTQIKAGANKGEVIQLFGEPHATRGWMENSGTTAARHPWLSLRDPTGAAVPFLTTTGLRLPSMTNCAFSMWNIMNQKVVVLAATTACCGANGTRSERS